MSKRYQLYCLLDPSVGGEVRYIGITSQKLEERLRRHIYDAEKLGIKNHRCCWIRSLLKKNIKPEIRLLDNLPTREEACKSEIATIKELREIGYRLVNGTDGGEGGLGNQYNLGKKLTQEHKAKLQTANILRSRPIIDQNKNTYPSLSEAARVLQLNVSLIWRVLNGEQTHTGGYIFTYV